MRRLLLIALFLACAACLGAGSAPATPLHIPVDVGATVKNTGVGMSLPLGKIFGFFIGLFAFRALWDWAKTAVNGGFEREGPRFKTREGYEQYKREVFRREKCEKRKERSQHREDREFESWSNGGGL